MPPTRKEFNMTKVYSYISVPGIKGVVAMYSEEDEIAFLELTKKGANMEDALEHSKWYYDKMPVKGDEEC